MGKHAVEINKLAKDDPEYQQLRERMGHTKIEILAGVIVGFSVIFLII